MELSWSKHVVNQNYIAYKEKQLQHIFENMEKKNTMENISQSSTRLCL